MPLDVVLRGEIEQGMEQPRIAHVRPRGLHLTFAQILVPGGDLPDDERVGEPVQIPAHGRVGDTEGTADLGRVPQLSVVMRDHQPESSHGIGRDGDAKTWQIALDERAHELLAPLHAVPIRAGEERPWKSAADPEAVPVFMDAGRAVRRARHRRR